MFRKFLKFSNDIISKVKDDYRLHTAIREVVISESPEQLEVVLDQYPDLLENETFIKIWEMMEKADEDNERTSFLMYQTAVARLMPFLVEMALQKQSQLTPEIKLALKEIMFLESDEELKPLLRRCPELLEVETVMKIGELQAKANNENDLVGFQIYKTAIVSLMPFIEELATQNKSSEIESQVKWAIAARKNISVRSKRFLDEAIKEAENMPEIVQFLQLFADEKYQEYSHLADLLIPELEKAERYEEAYTIKLISSHELASTIEIIDEATPDQIDAVKKGGPRICQASIQLSQLLQDKGCQAIYLGMMATFHLKTHNYQFAEKHFTEALAFYRELAKSEPQNYKHFLSRTLNFLGMLKVELYQLEEGEKFISESVAICRYSVDHGDDSFIEEMAPSLQSLGNVQYRTGKFTEAEKSYTEALHIFRKLVKQRPNTFSDMVAAALFGLGNLQRRLNRLADAEKSHNEAKDIYLDLLKKHPDFFKFRFDLVQLLNNLSNVQRERNRLEDAENTLIESIEICKVLDEQAPNLYKRELARGYHNLGVFQKDQGKLKEAEASLTRAKEILRELIKSGFHNYRNELATTLSSLGNVQNDLDNWGAAMNSYSESLEIARNSVKTDSRYFDKDLAGILSNIGHFRLRQNNALEAKKFFEEAIGLIENLRTTSITINDRRRIMGEHNRIYQGLLACYIRLKDWKKALELAELGKSRSLTDMLNLKSENLQPKAPTPESVDIVKELGKQYSETIRELQQLESAEEYLSKKTNENENNIKSVEENGADAETRLRLSVRFLQEQETLQQEKQKNQSRRFEAQNRLNSVLEEITKYDEYFPPKAKEIDSERIFEISRNTNRTIVIFRIISDSAFIIFVYPSHEKIHIEEIKGFGQKDMLEFFAYNWFAPYQLWNEGKIDNDIWEKKVEETLDALYEILMVRVHKGLDEFYERSWNLAGRSSGKNVLFVPTQSLALLPLHAASWKDDRGKRHHLIEEYTISYAPSVSVFNRCRENERGRATNNALFVTNPNKCDTVLHSQESSYSCAEFDEYKSYRSHLEHSEREVSHIEKILRPNKNLLGKDATKSSVIETLNKDNFTFSHFSCHGFYNQENFFESGLVMSDGVITLTEIINCNLRDNWLTTLSACETGMVDFSSPTDEHFGLPLGFVFAGSPSIWASLWSIDDEFTSDLMKFAYENLNKREFQNNKPEALRQAQLAMYQHFPNPYYWAGFQHLGI